MNILKRIHRWELTVEKQPRRHLLRIASSLFVISLLAGYVLSLRLSNMEQVQIEKKIDEIKQIEYHRMNQRIEFLKTSRLVKS